MLRAQLINSYPNDFISSLIGLTTGRFPLLGTGTYGSGDILKQLHQHVKLTQNATQLDTTQPNRSSIDIYAREGTPAIASNDGIIEAIGKSSRIGNYVVLQDAYGNRYTYSHLRSLAKLYPVPTADVSQAKLNGTPGPTQPTDPRPNAPASAGVQGQGASQHPAPTPAAARVAPSTRSAPAVVQQAPVYKSRLFAHPSRPASEAAGGFEQIIAEMYGGAGGATAFNNDFAGEALGLNSSNSVLKPLVKGASVVAGTVIGRVGRAPGDGQPAAAHDLPGAARGQGRALRRPGALPERMATARRRPTSTGRRASTSSTSPATSSGSVRSCCSPRRSSSSACSPTPACGSTSAAATTSAPARSTRACSTRSSTSPGLGLDPTVSALKCGHAALTTSGTVSPHATGTAVDISAINNTPLQGHMQTDSLAAKAVRALMQLQGVMQPDQIMSLLSFGRNSIAVPTDVNHINVAFKPLFGENQKLGQVAKSILSADQWKSFVSHLDSLSNPQVPVTPNGP